MTPQDMATLHARAFTDERPWTSGEFNTLINAKGAIIATAPRAYAIGRIIADEGELISIACAPDAQGTGQGQRVLHCFERKARHQGAVCIFLEVREGNDKARSLYAKNNYVTIGRRAAYYKISSNHYEDALILKKIFDPL